MKDKPAAPPEPYIWLQDQEKYGKADCGCELVGEWNGSGAALLFCPLHTAAPDLLKACKAARKHWGRLHDIISDLVEGSKLTEDMYPDDYAAIVLTLRKATEADSQAEKAIKKAEPPKKDAPGFFA